jgi:hypothetical protein
MVCNKLNKTSSAPKIEKVKGMPFRVPRQQFNWLNVGQLSYIFSQTPGLPIKSFRVLDPQWQKIA